jgi:hypothetical protein
VRQRLWIGIAFLGIFLILGGAGGSGAQAAPGCGAATEDCPPFLGEFGGFGSAAGQMNNPRSAADPDTGHVFALESGNRRVSEFDAEDNWRFVKAWGWGVRDGAPELQTCTAATGCMAGLAGGGAGQIQFTFGITLDESGNVWTLEPFSGRVQKFSPAGTFVLMVGGEVNQTKVDEREEQEVNAEPVTVTEAEENLCTAVSGDTCGEGTSGTGDGQFKFATSIDASELGSSGIIYVGDESRIQEFSEDGTYEGDIPLPGAGLTEALAVAPDNSLYVVSAGVKEGGSTVVREIGPLGEEIRKLKGQWQGRTIPKNPRALAVDAEGNVYVAGTVVYELPPPNEGEPPILKDVKEVIAFESDGDLISFEADKAGFGAPTDDSDLVGLATNVVGDGSGAPGEVLVSHFFNGSSSGKPFLSYVRVYGQPYNPKPEAPLIESQYTTAATSTGATVEALINPRFTADTTYQVEYGTGKCSEGGCESVAPSPPAPLGGGAVNTPVATGPVELTGLVPGTVYRFRFSAQNSKGDATFAGEGTFRTYMTGLIPLCSNDTFRTGAGALLPDCRAYEMVSPVDKEGGEIFLLGSVPGFPAGTNQGAADGEAITYSSYRAFADPDSAPYASQYLVRRTGSGWSNEAISPLREGAIVPGLDTHYRAFSEDLSKGWLVTDSEPVLTKDGLPEYRNIYRRDNGTGIYQAQCSAQPLETSAEEFLLEPQGVSADGSHMVFWANGRLLSEAAPGKVSLVYECVIGSELRLVSVLPGGGASVAGGSAGIGNNGLPVGFGFRENNLVGAVSEDGSRIFWTAAANGPGPLYVRINGTKTVQIAATNARFRVASSDGSRVIYSVGENLFEASVGSESSSSAQIAGGVEGFMGASEDTQFIYFVSREDLDGGGAAAAGQPNLYLYRAEADTFAFIGELSEDDARETFLYEESQPVLTPVARSPYNRSSRVSADGLHAAFTSSAPLTGFDNTDQVSGQADAEVFLYDAATDELLCASCNPVGARPKGVNLDPTLPFWSAAHIPGWENQFHASRALSADGKRLLFEAADRLALEDTNGVQDVYQWEAPGTGACTEASPTYSPQNGGCVDLISSGKSKQPSELVDASSDGSDVFFKTTESLWAGDPGLADIYDARTGGGFPPPPPPVDPCVSPDDCRPAAPAPGNPPPATSTFVGPGDVIEKPKPKPKRCRKGTHKVKKAGKVRCVKNKKAKKAGKTRRAAR